MHRHDPTVTPGAVPGRPVPQGVPGGGPPGAGTPSASGRGEGSRGLTGDDAVDAALALLDPLDGLPVREHVRVFDEVHTALQARLADVED